jgi:hypothetical protein
LNKEHNKGIIILENTIGNLTYTLYKQHTMGDSH